jgi:hypothetical protein
LVGFCKDFDVKNSVDKGQEGADCYILNRLCSVYG